MNSRSAGPDPGSPALQDPDQVPWLAPSRTAVTVEEPEKHTEKLLPTRSVLGHPEPVSAPSTAGKCVEHNPGPQQPSVTKLQNLLLG